MVFVTVVAQAAQPPDPSRNWPLLQKLLLLRQAGHREAALLRGLHTLEPLYFYLWHLKLLYWCFQALLCLL